MVVEAAEMASEADVAVEARSRCAVAVRAFICEYIATFLATTNAEDLSGTTRSCKIQIRTLQLQKMHSSSRPPER